MMLSLKDEKLKQLLSTDAGRRKLAASMMQPLRKPWVKCPVCGLDVRDLTLHAQSVLDEEHQVLSVLAS